MRLKIVSEGRAHETHVYAVDNDGIEHELEGVLAIQWSCDIDNKNAAALITFHRSALDVYANLAQFRFYVPPRDQDPHAVDAPEAAA